MRVVQASSGTWRTRREPGFDQNIAEAAREIIARVRSEGDAALFALTERFDGAKLSTLQVSEAETADALQQVGEEGLQLLRDAAHNIRMFHVKQLRPGFSFSLRDGVILGQTVEPLERVGLYVPGGTAAYPSTVLMNAIPAHIAGCPHIVITTPPGKDGRVNPWVLAAAHLAGVTQVYKTGGAQAIAALAYGTQTIPRVDKIVGPGNAYVAEAKRQVYGQVAIDMIAGPSEVIIIADGKSNPDHLACDLLAQAEHDAMASAVLLTPDEALAQAVAQAVEKRLPTLSREAIARASIQQHGMAVITRDLDEAMDIANQLAPEHLELSVDNPFDWLPRVRAAGSIFLGRYCPEALGDYYAGPNHTLPTNGTARFQSALSVDDFIKKTQYTYYARGAFLREADAVARLATQEGLTAHALSATVRKES